MEGNKNNLGKHWKLSEETKEKMSIAQKGKKLSEKHKKNISEKLKGKPRPKEVRRKISKAHKGKRHSEETKRKISESHKGDKNSSWKGGKSFELYGFDWTLLLRHSIRIRDCFVCQICKKNGWIVHHIDYNKENCNPNNLIILCYKCHGKTNFNRNYWINYFKVNSSLK